MWTQRQEIGGIGDRRELRSPEQLHRRCSLKRRQVQARVLDESGEIRNNKDYLVLIPAKESEHSMVLGIQKFQYAPAERLVSLPHGDEPLHPPQHGILIVLLRLHVERFVMRVRINDDGQ